MHPPAMFTNATLRSEQFSCPSCLADITVRLSALEAVEVDFPSVAVLVTHNPAAVPMAELAAMVADTDHTATAPIMPAA
ncbi:Copper chaperone CopZ [Corynebacterium appendicis CIP 107643]|uniref:Copper chaperone CopZ n=1 Tax=Corynebacterium appendicis CIP 107643 TaxID=1161099 RepID=A0A1N7JJS2_9CORY|nr:hypothetical protein [Corynebacterium appendicis]WJY61661.1 hypothetical protein CAPP_08775 [Corynebacterium appendicis CIP 107643]SIS49613.1 Copper chaperone CopZ [Corynebacterium appendicis CIP 107643]